MNQLRDVATMQPRILFVGINPSLRSAAVGHHFAGPGNPFWRLLHAAQLIPEALDHTRDRELCRFGLALTNLVPRATRAASEVSAAEYARGAQVLREKVRRLAPRVVALVGLTLYARLFPGSRAPGPGAKDERLEGAHLFVLPNPSGLNASYPSFAAKLRWFDELRQFASSLAQPTGG